MLWDPVCPRCGIGVVHCHACGGWRLRGTSTPTAPAQQRAIPNRAIPSTGELMPVVGLGSWITFNVGDDTVARDACTDVMRKFVESGGRMIDSSPMYASSQDVIGYGLHKAALTGRIFSADKVWISFGAQGREQIERSRQKWQIGRFDLVQVHDFSTGRTICRRCSR